MIRLTKKHRVTIRNICPLNPLLPILHFHGQDYVNAVAAALNAIASEPESVAAARGRLLRAALLHDTYEPATEDVRPIRILEAAGAYQAALLAAKRAKRGRK